MPQDRPDLPTLLTRVRAGDEEAARDLLRYFEPHVRRAVRRRLPMMLRSKFDSMDFVQSVWGEFFARLTRGEIEFDNPNQLAKFLSLVAQSKVANETKRRTRHKADVRRQVDLGDGAFLASGKGRDPTPSQFAVAHDRFDALLSGRPELHRQIIMMRADGFTFADIAQHLDIDERSARRIVQRIEDELDSK